MSARLKPKNYPAPDLAPKAILELMGTISPGPLPVLRRVLGQLKDGDVILLRTDFAAVRTDLHAWSRQTQNTVLRVERAEDGSEAFYIMKGDPWPVDSTLDAGSARCPTPVLVAKKQLMGLKAGQILKLTTDCASAPVEMNSWLKATPHRLVGMLEDIYGFYRFYIER